ncbi:MAG: BtpA/SgcQ family protein [Phycisphaeraceae bacterium]|nr:BtpA/SgcQ family protein [Phycisphaerae bacterium]MBX3392159.1 BtpA/SgcQ family protein [Phycisphaeraceae bacterium]
MPLFQRPCALIGMIHADALPGSPRSRRLVDQIARSAAHEARVIVEAGFDAVMIENMHDRPYVNAPHAPEVTAAMTVVACRVRDAVEVPIGVQVLSRGEHEALAVAMAADCRFIRCENFVYSHVADEGIMADAAAGPLLRRRRAIGADHVAVYCDIKKKHASHALTSDLSLADAAQGAEFFGADGVIITGAFTGSPADRADVEAARRAVTIPVLVGSGVTPEQIAELAPLADALIVGSYIKAQGVWSNPVEAERCRAIAAARQAAAVPATPRG